MTDNLYTVLGEPISFWQELKSCRGQEEINLIKDNSRLRAKVSYYEDLLDKMNKFRKVTDGS